jgi:hypothetical protein
VIELKRYVIIYLLVISLFFISSCSQTSDDYMQNSSSGEVATIASEIKSVVQNKKDFFCTETGKSIYFKDFHSGNYLFINDEGVYEYTQGDEEVNYSFSEFCVVDLDEDGYPELLLESTMSDILLFHYEDGVVYGFVFPFRGMKNVKKDTSFEGSGGATVIDICKISFSKEKAILNELCLFDGLDNIYRINNKDVSQQEAEKYLKEQDKKVNVEWHVYNEITLEKYFIDN